MSIMTLQIRDGYGYGVIQIDISLANAVMPAAKLDELDNVTTMGELRDQGVFEQVHRSLLLPERYHVVAIFLEFERFCWGVMVEAPIEECPRVESGCYLPNIAPVYRRLADGTAQLERLDINTREPKERVLCPD